MKCTVCGEDKDISCFYIRRDRNQPYRQCKECRYKVAEKWRKNNPDKLPTYFQNYKANNPEKYKNAVKRANSAAYKRNKLRFTISNAVYRSLSNRRKQKPTFESLGYTLEELRSYLESLFVEGMSWENYGEWHVDHIRPLCSFNITDQECEDFKLAWQLSNLQPLWATDNIRKGGRI